MTIMLRSETSLNSLLMATLTLFKVAQANFNNKFVTGLDESSTPFILPSGESYRDVVTLQNAIRAAQFAKKYHFQYKTRYRPYNEDKVYLRKVPKFYSRKLSKPYLTPDEDIFDFTDSRLIEPPNANSHNHPFLQQNEFNKNEYKELPRNQYQYQPRNNYYGYQPTPSKYFTQNQRHSANRFTSSNAGFGNEMVLMKRDFSTANDEEKRKRNNNLNFENFSVNSEIGKNFLEKVKINKGNNYFEKMLGFPDFDPFN